MLIAPPHWCDEDYSLARQASAQEEGRPFRMEETAYLARLCMSLTKQSVELVL